MRHLFIIALICLAPASVNGGILFPQQDAQGNDITPPPPVDKAMTSTYFGIGFKGDPHGSPDPELRGLVTVPDPTSLDVIDGGSLSGDVILGHGSTLNISGTGALTGNGNLEIYDTSKCNITGGNVYLSPQGAVYCHDGSTLMMSGGTVGGALVGLNQSTIKMSGGDTDQLLAENGANVTMSGGSINGAQANGGTLIIAVPATIPTGHGFFNAFNGGTLTASSGGTVGAVQAGNGGTIHTTDAEADFVQCDTGAAVYMTSGRVSGPIQVDGDNGRVSTDGTLIFGDVSATNSGHAQITGGHAFTLNAQSGALIDMEKAFVFGTAIAQSGGEIDLTNATVGQFVRTQNQSVMTLSTTNVQGSGGVAAQSYDSSNLRLLNGCTLTGSVTAFNNSQVNLAASFLAGDLQAQGFGTVLFNGGSIGGNLLAQNNGVAIMGDGSVSGFVRTQNLGHFEMAGGSVIGPVQALDSSSMILSQGAITTDVQAFGSSNITIGGGLTVVGDVDANGSSAISINGGAIYGKINAYNYATVVLNGALVPHAKPATMKSGGSGGTITPFGDDSVLPSIFLYDNSSLEVDGMNLSASLMDPNNDNGMFSQYSLSGFLADGSVVPAGLFFYVANPSDQNPTGASFTLVTVPEPSGIMLLAAATLGVGVWRRGRHCILSLGRRPIRANA